MLIALPWGERGYVSSDATSVRLWLMALAIASWSAIESLYGEFNINLAIFNVKWKFLKITKRSSKLAHFLLLL